MIFFIKFIILSVMYVVLDFDILKCIPIILPLILSVAFFTLLERKILAATQEEEVLMLLVFMVYCNLFLMD